MTREVVVDASALVECLLPGALEAEADRLLDALTWPDPLVLLAPDLVLLETANALRSAVLRKVASAPDADHAVRRLGDLPIATVATGGVLEDAWTFRGEMTVYDAAYVALALGLRVPLVTEDRRSARAARRAGAEVLELSSLELARFLEESEPR